MHDLRPYGIEPHRATLKTKHCLAIFQVDMGTLRDWIAAGKLQGARVNGKGCWFISRASVERLLNEIDGVKE